MAYQSLYRRYRPQRFGEIRGQRHVVTALQNAVVKSEVGHAYLLHGPRGTGKTTSARVLAKALNCEDLGADGEPCGACESCHAIEQGRSFDLHELDAASNNKVEDMRDLLGKVNLGNPGRAKVYILDEVHMLTSQAENALLKTLEEPPDHVTWVLATTEPHKVVETIRSRCQVFQLTLLGAEEMAEHVRWVIEDAQLDVSDAAVEYVVTAGGGSVRDTLSALDRVVAAGGVVEIDTSTELMVDAIAGRDVAAALAAVGEATARGRDPRTIGEAVLAGLRDAFLTAMGSPSLRLSSEQADRAAGVAKRMSPAAMTRAMETLGTAVVDMRQAPDPRIDLEVALVRLCRPDADRSLDALGARVEQLEAAIGTGAPPSTVAASASVEAPDRGSAPTAPAEPTAPEVPAVPDTPAPSTTPPAPTAPAAAGPGTARRALADTRGDAEPSEHVPDAAPSSPPTVPADPPPTVPAPPPEPVPSAAASPDLWAIRPLSPTEVVQLGELHLGLSRDAVITAANELLGERPRSEEALAELWVSLVDAHASPADTAEPVGLSDGLDHEGDPGPPADDPGPPTDDVDSAPPPVPKVSSPEIVREVAQPVAPVPDADPESVDDMVPGEHPPDDDIDIHDLVDAPSHTDELIERLTEAFPGAELHTTDHPEDDR